jgi:hypothetical protein
VTEQELEVYIREQGYDFLTAWWLVKEVRLRHASDISRKSNDTVGCDFSDAIGGVMEQPSRANTLPALALRHSHAQSALHQFPRSVRALSGN